MLACGSACSCGIPTPLALGVPRAGSKRATCVDCLRSRGAVKAGSLPAGKGWKAIEKVARAELQHARATGRPLQGPASTARKPLKKVSINAIASGCGTALLHFSTEGTASRSGRAVPCYVLEAAVCSSGRHEHASDVHVPSWLAACTDAVTDRSQVPEVVSPRCPLLRDEVAGGSGRSGRPPRERSAMRSRRWSSTRLRRLAAMLGTTLTPAACQMPRCMTARTIMTTTTSMTRCIS